MGKITQAEIENIKEIFELFAIEEDGIDAVDLGDILRALKLNPSLKVIETMGGKTTKGEKVIKLDEFISIYDQVKNDKDQGVYEDFIECLKLYDKNENGMIMANDLTHMLLNLGEKLTDKELEVICKDCMDEEDEDGQIPYVPFLARMCERPVPASIKPE